MQNNNSHTVGPGQRFPPRPPGLHFVKNPRSRISASCSRSASSDSTAKSAASVAGVVGVGIALLLGEIISLVGIPMPPPPGMSQGYTGRIDISTALALQGFFLAFISPYLYPYPVQVSTQAFIPGPPTLVVLFELTMLGMLISTFVGVFLDSFFPNYRPMKYVPEISDGKIAILVECPNADEKKITDALNKMGVESVKPAEAQHL